VIDGDRPDFQELVQKYPEYRSITSIRSKAGASYGAFEAIASMKGTFEATLNSQNKDGEKSKPLRKYLYGELHLFIDYPYLFAEVRKLG
jgi:hypothetical protein